MSADHFYIDLSGQPVPCLMNHKTGLWIWWDFVIGREIAGDRESTAAWWLWVKAMEATFDVDPALLIYVEQLCPAKTERGWRTLTPKRWGEK